MATTGPVQVAGGAVNPGDAPGIRGRPNRLEAPAAGLDDVRASLLRPVDLPDPDPRPAPPVGLYLHVPFCVSLCPYCDFVVVTGRASRGPASRIPRTLTALHAELEMRADGVDGRFGHHRLPLRSVYLGGGTPSLLAASAVGALLDRVARRFGIASDAEITLEANPGPGERGDVPGFRAAGVTRLSLGVQSLDAGELRALGRRHRPEDPAEAVRAARAAGIASVSLDLLTDVPGQTEASWRSTLRTALQLEPDHVSTYALRLDDPDADGLTGPTGDHLPVRPGARRWRERTRARQDEDRAADLDAITDALLADAGFARYELSNAAQPGHASVHNLGYWRRAPIEAVGPGAHAFDGALERRWNAARLDGYLAALIPAHGSPPVLPPGGRDERPPTDAPAEAAMLGLRLSAGIGSALAAHPTVSPAVVWARAAGLAVTGPDGSVRLTPRGRQLSNEVLARLIW